ncbi:MAG: hypothetical protein HY719_11620 [Planctomycetes bacterium]|nr:hypothetical protein [Planctomycetota bacterium]
MALTFDLLILPPEAGAEVEVERAEAVLADLGCFDGNRDHYYGYPDPAGGWTCDIFLNLADPDDEGGGHVDRDCLSFCVPLDLDDRAFERALGVARAISDRLGWELREAGTGEPVNAATLPACAGRFATEREREIALRAEMGRRARRRADESHLFEWVGAESSLAAAEGIAAAGRAMEPGFDGRVELFTYGAVTHLPTGAVYVRVAFTGEGELFRRAAAAFVESRSRAVVRFTPAGPLLFAPGKAPRGVRARDFVETVWLDGSGERFREAPG